MEICAYLFWTDSTSTRRFAVLRTKLGNTDNDHPIFPLFPAISTIFNPAGSPRSEQKFQVLVGRSRASTPTSRARAMPKHSQHGASGEVFYHLRAGIRGRYNISGLP